MSLALGSQPAVAQSVPAPTDAPASSQQKSPDAIIVEAANGWLVRYAALPPLLRQLLAPAAVEVAKLRRAALKRLIPREPETALALSLSPVQRQGLPKGVAALLETPMHATGNLVKGITEWDLPSGNEVPSPAAPLVGWSALIDGRLYEAFVFGIRLKHETKFDASVHGIVIDGLFAVDQSPLYELDDLELVQLGFQPGQIVAIDGRRIPIVFSDREALAKVRDGLITELLEFGPLPIGQIRPWNSGPKRVLVIRTDFPDRTGTFYNDGEILRVMADVNTFYDRNSQGRTSLEPTILPAVLRLPLASTSYRELGEWLAHLNISLHADALARDFDRSRGGAGLYDPDEYDRVIVVANFVFDYGVGRADDGGNHVILTGDKVTVATVAHEIGHTYGFIHSGAWEVLFGADPIGPGTRDEQGDAWDMMGYPSEDDTHRNPQLRHFNAFEKWWAGWLASDAIADGDAGGDFQLFRADSADAAGLRAIRIRGSSATYWLDVRRNFPWNTSMSLGIEVRRVLDDPSMRYGPVELLDVDFIDGGASQHSLRRSTHWTNAVDGFTISVIHQASDELARVVITRP